SHRCCLSRTSDDPGATSLLEDVCTTECVRRSGGARDERRFSECQPTIVRSPRAMNRARTVAVSDVIEECRTNIARSARCALLATSAEQEECRIACAYLARPI